VHLQDSSPRHLQRNKQKVPRAVDKLPPAPIKPKGGTNRQNTSSHKKRIYLLQEFNKSKRFIREITNHLIMSQEIQYTECYNHLRHHDRLIWMLPSVAYAINAGVLYAAFQLPFNNIVYILIREILILIGALLTFALLVAMIKHRYFSEIEQGTLSQIENAANLNRIQRTTFPDQNANYWYTKTPQGCLECCSAHKTLIKIMYLLLFILIALLFHPLLLLL